MNALFAGHIAVFAAATLLCFGAISRARQIQHQGTRHGFVGILVTCGLWSLGYLGYFLIDAPAIQVTFYTAALIAALACVGAWLYFSLAYTGRSPRQVPYRSFAIGVFLVIVLLKVTNPIHELFFTTEAVSEPFDHLALQHEILHWVVLGLAYVVIGISFFILLERFYYAGADARPLIALLGITAVPIGLNIIGVADSLILPLWYEPIGVAIFAVGTLFVYSQRFEAIQFAGAANEPAIFLDQDRSIRDFNQSAKMLFPALDGASGRALDDVVPEAKTGLSDDNGLVTKETAEGTRYFRVSKNPVTTGDVVTGELLTFTDETERERYRQQLEARTEQLEALNRVVRHDIRNDMAVILGWAQILPDHVDEEGEELLEHILEKSNHVIELTDIARDFVESMSGDDHIELRQLDVRKQIELEIETARESFPHARFHIEGEIPPVAVRANEMLSSVFRNILNNAVQHNDEETPEITVEVSEYGDTVKITIADNGPGISDEAKERVFGKGEKGLDSSGTGIGLYLAETLIEQFDGAIWIEDNEPKGSIFVIELPIAA